MPARRSLAGESSSAVTSASRDDASVESHGTRQREAPPARGQSPLPSGGSSSAMMRLGTGDRSVEFRGRSGPWRGQIDNH